MVVPMNYPIPLSHFVGWSRIYSPDPPPVIFTPYIGYLILPNVAGHGVHDEAEVYSRGLYPKFRRLMAGCLRHRRRVLTATARTFAETIARQTTRRLPWPFSRRWAADGDVPDTSAKDYVLGILIVKTPF